MKQLRLLREGKGLTQSELAKEFKISPSTIAMYERGERKPDPDMLVKIADFFNISIDSLLGREIVTQANTKHSSKREMFLKELENLTDEELLEMEQIADYIKSKKEKNEQAATTA